MGITYHYESDAAAQARAAFEKANDEWSHGEAANNREVLTARRRWHKLRAGDRAVEDAVRVQITPSPEVISAARAVVDAFAGDPDGRELNREWAIHALADALDA